MKGFLVVVALLVAAVTAQHQGRIGGGAAATADDIHACMLLVQRADIGVGQAAMGGGSIVARNRVLTAAHVIRDATSVQVGFFNGLIQANRFRRADSSYSQPIQSFVVETFANDLAVLQFAGNVFPLANVITIAPARPTGSVNLASFGFTLPNSLVPSQLPQVSVLTVADTCVATLKATTTHFCATATLTSVVCPGDNGSGLYTGTGAARRLVGVVSLIAPGCTTLLAMTGFAALDGPAVAAFLDSQNVAVAAP